MPQELRGVGMDIATRGCHLVGMDARGEGRAGMSPLSAVPVGRAACGGAPD